MHGVDKEFDSANMSAQPKSWITKIATGACPLTASVRNEKSWAYVRRPSFKHLTLGAAARNHVCTKTSHHP